MINDLFPYYEHNYNKTVNYSLKFATETNSKLINARMSAVFASCCVKETLKLIFKKSLDLQKHITNK